MMRHRFGAIALLIVMAPALASAQGSRPASTMETVGGIALDAPWKAALYEFAREKLRHPAWGWTHSERDYLLAQSIAAEEGLSVDLDILFAAAFIHDAGAIGEFQRPDTDHAERSVEVARPLLLQLGFPVEKWPAVREAILGHMHDKPAGKSNEAIVLHDADTLDFLGTVGIARRLSVTGQATDYSAGLTRIREFAAKLPDRLVTATAKRRAQPRIAEMRRFLAELEAQTEAGRLP